MGVWCLGGGCGLWVRVGGGVVVMVVVVGGGLCVRGWVWMRVCVCVWVWMRVHVCVHVCGHRPRRDSGARRSHSREGRGGHTREGHRFARSSRAFEIMKDLRSDVSTPCEQKQR